MWLQDHVDPMADLLHYKIKLEEGGQSKAARAGMMTWRFDFFKLLSSNEDGLSTLFLTMFYAGSSLGLPHPTIGVFESSSVTMRTNSAYSRDESLD